MIIRLKKLGKKAFHTYKLLTWQKRALPDFIIIGAQKAGTTSLFNYLSKHPDIIPPITKEVHYFDGGLNPSIDNFAKGEKWYKSHFPLRSKLKNKKTFEASPLYLFNPLAPYRIKELLPDVKLIALLRNPVDRAISHYFHEKRNNYDPLGELDAMKEEENRMTNLAINKDFKNREFIKYSYKSRGRYYEQLERYFSLFPKKNILVIESERFFSNPECVLKDILEFIGVDDKFKFVNLKPINTGYNKRKVDEELYVYLNEYFKPINNKLFEIIDDKYDW